MVRVTEMVAAMFHVEHMWGTLLRLQSEENFNVECCQAKVEVGEGTLFIDLCFRFASGS
jgi:hypothetical protein